VGKGGPSIRLDTQYGTIRLLRMGLHPPTPPTPPHPPAGDEKRAWSVPPHHRPFSGAVGRRVSFVPWARLVERSRPGERTTVEDLLDAYTPADLRWRFPPRAKPVF
jgi:hypothetical protein